MITACRKEQMEVVHLELNTGTSQQLFDLQFVDDSIGYACGGDKWTKGVRLYTRDGGTTWSGADSIFNAAAYSLCFLNASTGYIAGNVSNIALTTDSGLTFTTAQSDYRPILDIAFYNQLSGIKVGGDGYSNGYIARTTDGGNQWQTFDITNAINTVSYLDSNTIIAAGFGVVYKSTDAGANFNPLNVRGDQFTSVSVVSKELFFIAGYNGSIIKTTNGGNSFQILKPGNVPFSNREHFRCIDMYDSQHGLAGGDAGLLYYTNNGGDSWKKVKSFTHVNIRQLQMRSPNAAYAAGDEGKIFKLLF